MIEAMIDTETWGIRATSVVRSVGIVVFEGRRIVDTNYFRIDEPQQSEPHDLFLAHTGETLNFAARTTDQSTIDWWVKPENATAQATIAEAPMIPWEVARTICGRVGDGVEHVWAKPGMFDLPLLRDLFGQDIWAFWKERDLATLLGEFDPTRKTRPKFEGIPHNALDDAVHAHTWLCDLREKMGLHPQSKRLRDLLSVTATQSDPGNSGVNEYMRGMANGLILAKSCVLDEPPAYIEAAK